MGSFETDLNVPDLKKAPLKLSSIVLASQRVPNTAKNALANPLVRDGVEWIPNCPTSSARTSTSTSSMRSTIPRTRSPKAQPPRHRQA